MIGSMKQKAMIICCCKVTCISLHTYILLSITYIYYRAEVLWLDIGSWFEWDLKP